MSKAVSVSQAMTTFETEARVLFHALNYSRQHQGMSVREFCTGPAFTDALAAWVAVEAAIVAAQKEQISIEQQRGMERAGVSVPSDEQIEQAGELLQRSSAAMRGYDAPTMAGNEASPDDYPPATGHSFQDGDWTRPELEKHARQSLEDLSF